MHDCHFQEGTYDIVTEELITFREAAETMPGGRVHLSELHHGASFCSDNDPRLIFGVGRLEVVPRVSVRWPDGAQQTFENVRTGSGFVIAEGNGRLLPDHRAPR